MQIAHSDSVFTIDPESGQPDYDRGNTLLALADIVAELRQHLAAGQSAYLGDSLQFLIPFTGLKLYGPATQADWQVSDPRLQNDKNDFQKQNVKDFQVGDTMLLRGWARDGDRTVPFLRLIYRGGPDSVLSEATGHDLGDSIKLWAQIGSRAMGSTIDVPYSEAADAYAIEIWGSLDAPMEPRAAAAEGRGELIARPDLLPGSAADFAREGLDGRNMQDVSPDHPMHPILPLALQVAWANAGETSWDSRGGANYRYEFSMQMRGWHHFLQAGISPNPHGGVGFLEFRNLFSNYFGFSRDASGLPASQATELGRLLEPWQQDAHRQQDGAGRREDFMAVEYMDLHSVNVDSGIGLHRHRDNNEAFLMMEGQGLMVIGDWCQMPHRERAMEARTLNPGHLALLKGGQLHGLLNLGDQPARLFMFGGYD